MRLKQAGTKGMLEGALPIYPVKLNRMSMFEKFKPGARFKVLDAAGIAEVVSVSRFGADALMSTS
jgi:hypothetical protein